MNIGNVLVPVDFSLPAKAAVQCGVVLARRFRAHLTLVQVMQPSATGALRRDEAVQQLASLVAPEDEDDLDLRVVVKSGDVGASVIAAIQEQRADVVVMGTHKMGRLESWLIGSTTQHLLRKLPVPVMTVRSGARPLKFDRILFSTDLSSGSAKAFESVLSLAQSLQATLIVMHVQARAGEAGGEMQAMLQKFETAARAQEVLLEREVAVGDPAEQILQAVRSRDVGILAIAVQKKPSLEKILIGATAERLVREAEVPVLSIPVGPQGT